MSTPPVPELPLRDRLPGYAALLAAGIAACTVAGLAWSALTDASFAQGTGWSALILASALLLLGGTAGSGLSRMSTGDYGIHYGRRHHHPSGDAEGEILRIQDLEQRLRAGLRPRANAAAFWQVVGGLALAGFGLAMLSLAG